ncbi:MAG: signal peptidase I [Bacteroidetes bacterium]|nr:signal peptidase I [Bacteroidota bacterium]
MLGGLGVGFIIFYLLFIALIIVSLWKVFEKAGKPGWASIVPIYNIVVMLKIVKKPLWWILLLLIPFVNVIIGIIVCIEMAKAFGKDIGFAIGLLLLGFIFYPILAFGDAKYVYGDNAEETPAS